MVAPAAQTMTNPIAKAVHCPTCGAPPRVACIALNPGAKKQIVPTHSARKKAYQIRIRPKVIP